MDPAFDLQRIINDDDLIGVKVKFTHIGGHHTLFKKCTELFSLIPGYLFPLCFSQTQTSHQTKVKERSYQCVDLPVTDLFGNRLVLDDAGDLTDLLFHHHLDICFVIC